MDLDNLLAAVIPATQAMQAVLSAWQTIAGQVATLKDLVSTDPSKANEAIKKLVDSEVVNEWNALATAGKHQTRHFGFDRDLSVVNLSRQVPAGCLRHAGPGDFSGTAFRAAPEAG